LDIPAAGSGASATYLKSSFVNNTAVNSTLYVPSGVSLSSNQYVVLGIGEPISGSLFTAAGAAMTYYLLLTVAVPVAYLPNGSMIYNAANTINQGDSYTFAITHVSGYWWKYTYNGAAITGSDAWENGTYNLGASVASGAMCEEGATVGPSFVAILYGDDGAATPSMPETKVPWAIGIGPSGEAPLAANAMPQFNSTLGVMGIESHTQNAALGVNHLEVGSTVTYPGAFVSLWGKFKVVILNSSKISPITASIAYNATQWFNATALDQNKANIPAASYSWQISPAAIGTLNTMTGPTVIVTAGSTTISGKLWANVTYNCSTISDVASVTVTKTGGVSIESFAAVPTPIIIGQSSWINVTNASWAYPITYHYVGLPGGCATANVSSLLCSPTVAGNYTVKVYLNDSLKHSSSATTGLLVYQDLGTPTFKISPSALTVNTTMTINVTVVGGIPPLTYEYTGLPSGCANGRQPAGFTCYPNASGTYTPRVFVNDSASHGVTATSSVVINVGLTISAFTASPSVIPFGGTTYLNVTPNGGTPPYKYVYAYLPAGCVTANSRSLVCTPTTNGTFLPEVNITDSTGYNASGFTTFTVSPPTTLTVTSFIATPSTIGLGNSTTVTALVSGGVGPYTYTYSGMPAGCSSTTASFTCRPTAAGSFNISLNVADSMGDHAFGNASLTVTSPVPAITISSFNLNPSSVTVGSGTTLTVAATGGETPYIYTYTGLPAGCASADQSTLSCTPNVVGTFNMRVFVNDSIGQSASSVAALTVSNSTSTSGSSNTMILVIVVVVVVVAVVAVVAVLMMRKKKAAPPPPPQAYYAQPPMQQYGAPQQQPYMGPPPQQGPPPQAPPPYR
jgi:hypothetical protein